MVIGIVIGNRRLKFRCHRGHIPLHISTTLAPPLATILLDQIGAAYLLLDPNFSHVAQDLPKLPVLPWNSHEDLAKDTKEDDTLSDATIDGGSAPQSNTSYFLHSTGSVANPKPIPIMAQAALNFACLREYDSWISITSLSHSYCNYHAAMSLARAVPIYLAPVMPINGENLVKVIKATKGKAQVLLAVPIFLELIFGHPEGLQVLKSSVDDLHVAGGAVSSNQADLIALHGIKLQYVVASTEAGAFLYSGSAKVTGWEWMTVYPTALPYIKMEIFDEENGGSEVVVKKGFPTLQVSNRPNGDYATGDLFLPGQKQSENEGQWRYWRRQDEVLVHSHGLKSDPISSKFSMENMIYRSRADCFASVENTLLTCPLITQILIVGAARPCTAAIILPRDDKVSIDNLQSYIDDLNKNLASQSRLQGHMVKILEMNDSFVMSPKGTVFRKRTEEKFRDIIEAMYSQ